MNTQKIKLTILLKSKLIFHNTDKLGTYGADLQKSLVPRRVKGGAGDVVNLYLLTVPRFLTHVLIFNIYGLPLSKYLVNKII